ncbi:hypothetical protein EN742_02955 [Mesorhizobium sp. M4A.F.Ca.ET.020.02.1.1]|uniref:hypothetical protein n=1 Tax=Mesorhizobium sp. M4A.F.Ca.ET.020.02.1.1 TaxID=2496652 RepID=UPI000FD56881|nr:hypothetical protein [Mesorhizobium sp. M4A.F.Ca.ET.020.02.1.1]RVD44204.1 hypothetical protein EN742_02955 [Mesorhizobium sp. M4A.F.Ca.ET.020.02.1.1]
MLTIATVFWDANSGSYEFSRCFDEEWVEKLYRGFKRNLTVPFRFVCFTERPRQIHEEIAQQPIATDPPGYGALIEPYRLGDPMILVGLDTIVVGNCDALAAHVLGGGALALPRDPYARERACTGVVLAPAGSERIWLNYTGIEDMEHMRKQPHVYIDDLFPGQVLSWKGDIRGRGDEAPPPGASIIYFHGASKPHELNHLDWVWEHWS